jgi:6-phospho-3-hexuloisomerase
MYRKSLDFIQKEISDAVSSISEESQDRLIDLLLKKKTIFIYGSGRSGLVGKFFAVRLVQLGLDVHFVGDMTTPIISKDDLAVLISNTGETMSAVQTANIARRIGCHVICLTSASTSKLAHASNDVICLDVMRNSDTKLYAPLGTIFEDAVVMFFDSIVPCLMKKLECTEDCMRKRHAIWV